MEIADGGRSLSEEEARTLLTPYLGEGRSRVQADFALAAAHHTVVRHGGDIVLEGQPAGGTRFTLTLQPATA